MNSPSSPPGSSVRHILEPLSPVSARKAWKSKLKGDEATFYAPSHYRRTKIVCAIGPASQSKEVIGSLLDAGMNIARLNMSHGTHEFHATSVKNLRDAIEDRRAQGWTDCSCAILMDTKGPEIRTGLLRSVAPEAYRGPKARNTRPDRIAEAIAIGFTATTSTLGRVQHQAA